MTNIKVKRTLCLVFMQGLYKLHDEDTSYIPRTPEGRGSHRRKRFLVTGWGKEVKNEKGPKSDLRHTWFCMCYLLEVVMLKRIASQAKNTAKRLYLASRNYVVVVALFICLFKCALFFLGWKFWLLNKVR